MYISVKEASELTGKSSTTIYRLCKKRIKTRFVKKDDNKLLIDKDFVMAAYPPEYETVDVVLTEDMEMSNIDNDNPINLVTEDVSLNEQEIKNELESVNTESALSDSEIELSNMLLIDEKDELSLVEETESTIANEAETSDDEWQSVDLEYSNSVEFDIENTANEGIENTENNVKEEVVPIEKNSNISEEQDEVEKPETYFKNITSKDVVVKVAMGIVILSGFLVALYFMSLDNL